MQSSRSWSRRDVLATTLAGSTAAAIGSALPRPLRALTPRAHVVSALDPIIVIDSTEVRALALRALDAAKSAGAQYADVRLTRQLTQNFYGGGGLGQYPFNGENERLAVGVRAYVRGAWGFAASPYWTSDDVVRLAREAAQQATTNSKLAFTPTAWNPIPVASGHWSTPIQVDPFVVSVEEKGDFLNSWSVLARRNRIDNFFGFQATFVREERAVATSDGAYFTQTLYQSGGSFDYTRENIYGEQHFGQATADGLGNTAAGWEIFPQANIAGQISQLYEAADPDRPPPPMKPGDIGRYDVVFDGASMGALLDRTIGVATQVDRALGYEANASGTSYLGPDPLALLGTYQAAAPIVTVTADRSMSRGVGTVKWDDEGVEPEPFTLVKDGVLTDYQTTRDQANLLAPWYQKRNMPVRSHGCAAAESALNITMQHTPNLTLEPGVQELSFDTLVSDTKRGLAVMGAEVMTDFQARTGVVKGLVREIVNGRLGAVIVDFGVLFNTTQLWKNIIAIGGSKSAVQFASSGVKGEPRQTTSHSVRAVPAKATNVDVVDLRRKA